MPYGNLDLNYDDSSDEESIDKRIENYNISESWKLFTQSTVFPKLIQRGLNSREILRSFFAHALGVELLYEKRVNSQYYKLKRKYLSQSFPRKFLLFSVVFSTLRDCSRKFIKDFLIFGEENIHLQQKDSLYLAVLEITLCVSIHKREKSFVEKILQNSALIRALNQKISINNPSSEMQALFRVFNDEFVKFLQEVFERYNLEKVFRKYYQKHNNLLAIEEFFAFLAKRAKEWDLDSYIENYKRKTYPSRSTLVGRNPLSFFSNLRLSNRSRKRCEKNLQHNELAQVLLKNNPKKAISTVQKWSFSEEISMNAVDEIQGIMSSGKHTAKVNDVTTYSEIVNEIKLITELISKKSGENEESIAKSIIKWLRQIINGNELSLKSFNLPQNMQGTLREKLEEYAHHWIGTEGTRNPAVFICNQMAFDLMEQNSHISWEDTIKNLMPMSPNGSTHAAREVNEVFKDYMPYPYEYDSPEKPPTTVSKHAVKLIKREAEVVKKWVLMHSQKEHLSSKKISAVANFIKTECNWYDYTENEEENLANSPVIG